MNIENGSFQLNQYSGNTLIKGGNTDTVNYAGKSDSVQSNSSANSQVSGNTMITQVTEGQMFAGNILDINGNQVIIGLDGQATLRARMAESVNLNIGDSLSFLVKENSGTSVLIQPASPNTELMKDTAIFKLLEQNKLSPSDKNYQIAENLLSKNMPVDRATMQNILQQSYKYPDTSISTLVEMNKMGLPVTSASIEQFEMYQNNQHQLMNGIVDLSNNLANTVSNPGEQTSVEHVQNTLKEVLQLVADKGELSPVESAVFFAQETISSTPAQKEMFKQLDNLASDFSNKMQYDDSKSLQFLNQLVDAGIPEASVQTLLSKSETPIQFMNHLQQMLEYANKNDIVPSDKLQTLLQSEGMKDVLAHVIKQKLTIQPEKLQEPGEVTDYYKQLYEKAGAILEHTGSGDSSAEHQLSQSAKGMQERIDFMQNLNQLFAYTQLPVRIDGKDKNADFFVYMNKKRLQEKREDVSALLHLDMEYLGPTDVHVSLRGTMVHTKFYVEDVKSAKLIDEHMTMLEKAVAENGFSLTNEVIMREPALHSADEKNPVIREMFEDDIEKSLKRYSFDVRG